MNIERIEQGTKGAFIIQEHDKRVAEMTYSKAGDNLIIIDHTEVSDSLRGTGAGKQLVTAAVNYAREKNIKILPLCPFAKSVFDRNPAFADVLSK
jgi:predicted GNAT family acetyltransferase